MVRPCPVCHEPLPAGMVRHLNCADYHRNGLRAIRQDNEAGWRIGQPIVCPSCGEGWDGITKAHKPKIVKGEVTLVCSATKCVVCEETGVKAQRPIVDGKHCATHAREAKR